MDSWKEIAFHGEKLNTHQGALYIDLVAEAVCKYGSKYMLNMDETSVRINNGSAKTLAPIGLEEIVIDAKRNDKECFTAIGTCTYYEVKKMIILTKGTEKTCPKFKAGKDSEFWPTNNQNGWVNEEIMIQYLLKRRKMFSDIRLF